MTRGIRLIASAQGAVVLALAASASAEPPPATPSTLGPPPVRLTVTPGAPGLRWQVRLENTGEEPLRIPADAHLLAFEITPPAADSSSNKKPKKPTSVRCVLPDDARPSTDEGRELVIPAKRSWSVTIDPRFFCFGARERSSLVAGSQVKARFGWAAPASKGAKPAPAKPPFAVTPVGAALGKFAPAKMVESEPFTLSEATAAVPAAASTASNPPRSVSLSVPEAMDAARGTELATTVTLTNHGDRAVTLLFRPDMVEFRVTGPSGSIWCGSARVLDSPIRELFVTVPAKGKTSTSILLTSSCPPGTFDDPAVYQVLPHLDTTQASGRAIGLATWEGIATGHKPLLVRVRKPKTPALPPRPTLD